MKRFSALIVIALLMSVSSMLQAQELIESSKTREEVVLWGSAMEAYSGLEKFNGLWRGAGEGKWGASDAEKQFASILGGKVVCRGGRSVYPQQKRNPEGETHLSHSLFSLTDNGKTLSLSEYDNEGFIAHYALDLNASKANLSWIFELVRGENLPPNFSARLSLVLTGKDQYTETFELDFSGKGYVTYLTNRLWKISDKLEGGCGNY
ncbi:hypothetical protein [Shewanella atlantica]|uniref:DUF1579 domain-containing protein n=1 Tax=Shewanella atlantica TaxID=271099 RepID=A0A3S0KSD6_9GAMM|nr:hypothetical protein [Shewanella atlantica]RTR33340.1 hypothetical protein EKG39_06235 [Shewanella atlantica]